MAFRRHITLRLARLSLPVIVAFFLFSQLSFDAKAQSNFCSSEELAYEDFSTLLNQTEFFRYSLILRDDPNGATKIIRMESAMRALLLRTYEGNSTEKASVLFQLYSFLYWLTLLEITENNPQILEAGSVYVNFQELRRYFQNDVPVSSPGVHTAIMCLIRCEKPEVSVSELFGSSEFNNCLEGGE